MHIAYILSQAQKSYFQKRTGNGFSIHPVFQ